MGYKPDLEDAFRLLDEDDLELEDSYYPDDEDFEGEEIFNLDDDDLEAFEEDLD